jgi:branched-chain amino acid transport system permease protein
MHIINHGKNPWAVAVASLAEYIIWCAILSLMFGDDVLSFRWYWLSSTLIVGSLYITISQVILIIAVPLVYILLWIFLRFARRGQAFRAAASDQNLALAVGISIKHISILAIAIGASAMALAGVLAASDLGVTSTLGFGLLLNGVTVSLLGGLGKLGRTYSIALLLAGAQQLTTVLLGLAWADTVTYAILVIGLALVAPRFQRQQEGGFASV